MSGISFTGLGSGMPVQDIVSGLVNAERVPFENRLNAKGSELTTKISANGALKSALDELESSLEKLTDDKNYQLRSASGDDDFISITSDKTAQVGSYDIKVNNLAQAHKLMSTPFDSAAAMGEGKLSFTTPNNTTGFSIDVLATDTLSEVRDKINVAADNNDVTATIITDSNGKQNLVMTSNNTGVENALTINATQSDGVTALDPASGLSMLATGVIETKAALDASVTVDGQITLSSSTNEFKNAIDGITLTAKKAHGVDDAVSNASISEDHSLVETELQKFVDGYNSYRDLAGQLGQASSSGSGPLAGDSMLRGITSKLRSLLNQEFSSDDTTGTLSLTQLGVSADQYGKLSLDKDLLNEQLNSDPDAVQKFFVGTDAVPGFAATTESLIKNYTDVGGLIDSRVQGYQDQISELTESQEAFNRKMEQYESRLLAQYNAMDILVANMTSTSSYVMSQLNNMPGVVRATN